MHAEESGSSWRYLLIAPVEGIMHGHAVFDLGAVINQSVDNFSTGLGCSYSERSLKVGAFFVLVVKNQRASSGSLYLMTDL